MQPGVTSLPPSFSPGRPGASARAAWLPALPPLLGLPEATALALSAPGSLRSPLSLILSSKSWFPGKAASFLLQSVDRKRAGDAYAPHPFPSLTSVMGPPGHRQTCSGLQAHAACPWSHEGVSRFETGLHVSRQGWQGAVCHRGLHVWWSGVGCAEGMASPGPSEVPMQGCWRDTREHGAPWTAPRPGPASGKANGLRGQVSVPVSVPAREGVPPGVCV